MCEIFNENQDDITFCMPKVIFNITCIKMQEILKSFNNWGCHYHRDSCRATN